MDYENFKEKIVNDLKDELYERGEDVTIRINEVKKLREEIREDMIDCFEMSCEEGYRNVG